MFSHSLAIAIVFILKTTVDERLGIIIIMENGRFILQSLGYVRIGRLITMASCFIVSSDLPLG